MDEVNVFFSGIIRAADERLTTGVTEQRANATRLRLISIVGGIVIIMVVGGAAVTVVRYTRENSRARTEVECLNASLEQRVAARTADLARANAEIQRFAHIVSHDLRAPLVNIVGFTGELENGLTSLRRLEGRSEPAGARRSGAAGGPRRRDRDLPEAIGFHPLLDPRRWSNLIGAILKLSREGRRRLQAERIDLGGDHHRRRRGDPASACRRPGGKINFDLQVNRLIQTDRPVAGADPRQPAGQRRQVPRRTERPLQHRRPTRARSPGDRVDHRGRRQRPRHRRARSGARVRSVPPLRHAGPARARASASPMCRALVRNLGGDISVTSELGAGHDLPPDDAAGAAAAEPIAACRTKVLRTEVAAGHARRCGREGGM